MVEKFSDFEGSKFLDKAGSFIFTITDAELTNSKRGDPMVALTLESDEGMTTVYHSLNQKARWSYNRLIAAAFKLTDEQKKTFELDYQTIHRELLGKQVLCDVEEESYKKEIKVPTDLGTFETTYEDKISYKVKDYHEAP